MSYYSSPPSHAAADKRKRSWTHLLHRAFELFAVPVGILLVWILVTEMGWVNTYLLPPPLRVVRAAVMLIEKGRLQSHIGISLKRVFSGYLVSTGCAIPLALMFYLYKPLGRLFHGVLEFLRAVPPLSMIPLLILWFGIGESSKLAVIILATFFPIFLNTLGGFESVDGRWTELSHALKLSFPRYVRYVLFPGALPQIFTGLRLGFGYSWRALMGAELFASSSGLGYLISDAQNMARPDIVLVGIFSIGFLGLFFDFLLRFAVQKYTRAGESRWGTDG